MNKRKPAYLVIIFLVVFNSHPLEIGGQANLPQGLLKPLTIGDTVPDLVLENIINYPSSSARLSNFKGKLLILDFWASWCTTCLKNFPKLDSLQNASGGDLKVLLVNGKNTGDDFKKLGGFFKGWKSRFSSFALPSLVLDSVLTQRFPHKLLPHYVWLDSNRRVLAITGSSAITPANIAAVLSGRQVALNLKEDVMNYNADLALLENKIPGKAEALISQSTFMADLDGLPTSSSVRTYGNTRKITFINHSILQLYLAATGINANRVILEVKDSSRFVKGKQAPDQWKNCHYSYELAVPANTPGPVQNDIMLADLNRNLGINARLHKRITDCWVLSMGDSTKLKAAAMKTGFKRPAAIQLKNQPLGLLIKNLNSQLPGAKLKPIVVDETGYSGNVNLQLVASGNDLPALAKELLPYGLVLAKQRRTVEFLVIKGNNAL